MVSTKIKATTAPDFSITLCSKRRCNKYGNTASDKKHLANIKLSQKYIKLTSSEIRCVVSNSLCQSLGRPQLTPL